MRPNSRLTANKQRGFALFEVMLAAAVFSTLIAGLATYLRMDAEDRAIKQYSEWMASYVNAVAGYMAQNPTAPAVLTRTGTDWLKSDTCGGSIFDDDTAFLSCNVPTNFNNPYGMSAPTVTFDYTSNTNPSAAITFGTVVDEGEVDPVVASRLSSEMTRRIEVNQGYQHIEIFHASSNDVAELSSGLLRGVIDNNIGSDIHLRLDGSNSMKNPIVSESTTWALIARDENANENVAARDSTGSINANDVFVRASGNGGFWASETHELAETAYIDSLDNVKFVGEVLSGQTVEKPTCEGGLQPRVFADPSVYMGGNQVQPELLAGVRRQITDQGTNWRIDAEVLVADDRHWRKTHEGGRYPARILVITRCS